MNTVHAKNNRYKNGEYNPHQSASMAKDKAKSIVPTLSQVKYRDDLYRFCVERKLISSSFKLGRTKQTISSNIRAFITVVKKHGLLEEALGEKSKEE